jgi:pimeloyl-ACP methyl ester carboxylesterase
MSHLPGPPGQLTFVPYIIDNGKQRIPAELGRLLVPERRSDPHSKLLELAFVRLKSSAYRPGPPLIFLAGGPGISGIDALRWGPLADWFEALRQVGDVIALDQRSTGLSLPRLDSLLRWDLPPDQPGSREEMLHVGLERSRATATFWREQGIDLFGYTTRESVDDIDDLRQALGLEQVNLYGASYGSHLALATIRRHGPWIGRAIIAMVEGPDHTLKLPSNIQHHLEDLAALVRADARLGAPIPDFLALIQSVFERLEQAPIFAAVKDSENGGSVNIGISKFDLQLLTASGLGVRSFTCKLPARYLAMAQGDFTWAASRILARRRAWLESAMSYLMDSASGASPERLARIRREVPTTLLGDLINFPFPEISEAWGDPDLGPAFRTSMVSDVPTLFMSGTLDARTPVSNAHEIRAGFSNSQHLIVEGATHATADHVSAPGVISAMLDFLRGEQVELARAAIPFAFAPLDAK